VRARVYGSHRNEVFYELSAKPYTKRRLARQIGGKTQCCRKKEEEEGKELTASPAIPTRSPSRPRDSRPLRIVSGMKSGVCLLAAALSRWFHDDGFLLHFICLSKRTLPLHEEASLSHLW
jgi:hypothetical protein